MVAAGYLALQLLPASSAPVEFELSAAEACDKDGRGQEAFRHLERAHVLAQASTVEHVRVHLCMLRWSVRQQDVREALGQVFRIVGAAITTMVDLVPYGNTGGSNVSAFRPMPVPSDLAALMAASPRRNLRAFMAAASRAGESFGSVNARPRTSGAP